MLPCWAFFQIFWESFQFFPFKYDVSCGIFLYSFSLVVYVPLYSQFVEWFFYEKVLNLFKCFFCISLDDHVLIHPSDKLLVIVCIQINYKSLLINISTLFHMLKHPCIPGTNLSRSGYIIILMCCCIWVAGVLLSTFAFIFLKDMVLHFVLLFLSLIFIVVIVFS